MRSQAAHKTVRRHRLCLDRVVRQRTPPPLALSCWVPNRTYGSTHNGEVWVECGGVIIGSSNTQNKGEARQYNVSDLCENSTNSFNIDVQAFLPVLEAGGETSRKAELYTR